MNYYRISMHTEQPDPLQEFQRSQVEKAVIEVNKTLSLALDTIDEIYFAYNVNFNVPKDYAHRVLMSLVAPVDLKVKYNVQEAEFFTTKLQFNPKPAQQNEPSSKTFQSKLSKLTQKITQYHEKGRAEEINPVQHKPQMMSILNKIKTSRDEGSTNYYKGPSDYKAGKAITKHKKNNFAYPSVRFEDEDEVEKDKQKCKLGSRLEEQISNWVRKEFAKGKKVTRFDLSKKAVQMRGNSPFKASRAWQDAYFKRYPQIRDLILAAQKEKNESGESSSQNQSNYQTSRHQSNETSYESYEDQPNGHKKQRQSEPMQKSKKMEDEQGEEGKQQDRAVYEDGEKKIIIYKGITNQAKQSKYTSGRRNKKSYINGNGFYFKNHSRFKDAYFSDLNKSKQVNSVIIVKANEHDSKKEPNNQSENLNNKCQAVQNKPENIKNQIQNQDTSSKHINRSRKKNDSDSKLRSYLNLMKYETIRPSKE